MLYKNFQMRLVKEWYLTIAPGRPLLTEDQQEWYGLVSSILDSIRYDADQEILYVTFVNGAQYYYEGVPEDVVEELLDAVSHGSYFYWNIRTSFPYTRINEELNTEPRSDGLLSLEYLT